MDLQFNKHRPDIFCTFQGDVAFHKLNASPCKYQCQEVAATAFLKKGSDHFDIRCMQWHPSAEHCNVIALGQSNGRVVLKSGDAASNRFSLLAGKEFVSKNQKPCSAVTWNNFNPSWLAVGLEKHTRQNCLIIWDVMAKLSFDGVQSSADRSKSLMDVNLATGITPVAEYGISESVNSLTWSAGEPSKILLAGMNRKSIRLFDIRMQSSQPSSVQHKATYGLCIDPLQENRLASFHDSSIVTWDMRYFSAPVKSLHTPKPVKKIEWSGTRKGMLCALFSTSPSNDSSLARTDNSALAVYDMINVSDSHDSEQGHVSIRNVPLKFPDGDWVTSFAWHPTLKSTILACSSGSSFCMSTISERTAVNWGSSGRIALACGASVSASKSDVEPTSQGPVFDPGELLKKRAINLYGLKESARENISLCLEPFNLRLHNVWHLFQVSGQLRHLNLRPPSDVPPDPAHQANGPWGGGRSPRSMAPKTPNAQTQNECFKGIVELFKDHTDSSGEPSPNASTSHSVSWIGVKDTTSTVYTSHKRNLALAMCGWNVLDQDANSSELSAKRFGNQSVGERLARILHRSGHVTRACAVAVWHLDVRLAIDLLREPSAAQNPWGIDEEGDTLSAVAMAMSGYTGADSPTLWLDTCRRMRSGLRDPYLQMTFSFLIANADHEVLKRSHEGHAGRFDDVLGNKALLFQDRVAFSLIFLPDVPLIKHLSALAQEVTCKGDLDGWLLTGVSTQAGVQLMQNYVDKTMDLQTVLCACMATHDQTFLQDASVQLWKDCYCQLLNRWQLYVERVHFNRAWAKACNATKPSAQVYVYCNYCNKNVCNSSKTPEMVARRAYILAKSSRLDSSTRNASPERRQESPRTAPGPPSAPGTPLAGRQSLLARLGLQFSPGRLKSATTFSPEASSTPSKQTKPSCLQTHNSTSACAKELPDKKVKFSGERNQQLSFSGRGRTFMGGNLTVQTTVNCCPSCRKPLPRCSVCSMNVGTRPNETDVDKWLTWCMTCRHGGHQGHLIEWFRKFKQCPVSDCTCLCDSK